MQATVAKVPQEWPVRSHLDFPSVEATGAVLACSGKSKSTRPADADMRYKAARLSHDLQYAAPGTLAQCHWLLTQLREGTFYNIPPLGDPIPRLPPNPAAAGCADAACERAQMVQQADKRSVPTTSRTQLSQHSSQPSLNVREVQAANCAAEPCSSAGAAAAANPSHACAVLAEQAVLLTEALAEEPCTTMVLASGSAVAAVLPAASEVAESTCRGTSLLLGEDVKDLLAHASLQRAKRWAAHVEVCVQRAQQRADLQAYWTALQMRITASHLLILAPAACTSTHRADTQVQAFTTMLFGSSTSSSSCSMDAVLTPRSCVQKVFLIDFRARIRTFSVPRHCSRARAPPPTPPPLLLCDSSDTDTARTGGDVAPAPAAQALVAGSALPAAQRTAGAVREGSLTTLTGLSAKALARVQPFVPGGYKARRRAELLLQQARNVDCAEQDEDGVAYEPMAVCSADTSISTQTGFESAVIEDIFASKPEWAATDPYAAMARMPAPPASEQLAAGCSATAERVTGTTFTLAELMEGDTVFHAAEASLVCTKRWSLRDEVRATPMVQG